MALTTATEVTPEGMLVGVCGEVDVACADELRDVLSAALASDVDRIDVDLAEVPYIDSTGIGVLVGAARRAADAGIAFGVVNPQHNVARVFGMLDLADELGLAAASTAQD